MVLILSYYKGLADNFIVLGKHSGRHAFRNRLAEMGYTLSDSDINSAFLRFKELADKKKEISNLDIESIISDEIHMINEDRYKLLSIQVQCGNQQIPTATASVRDETTQQERTVAMVGTGPVDAAFKAIESMCPHSVKSKLLEYTVSSVTAGIDALGEVTVRLQDAETGRIVFGRSANTDVIVASAQAYINALNRLLVMQGTQLPTHPQFNTL